MNVGQLISLLQDLDPEADVTLGIDNEYGETDLVNLTIDDVVLANSYVAFQVPNQNNNEESDDE